MVLPPKLLEACRAYALGSRGRVRLPDEIMAQDAAPPRAAVADTRSPDQSSQNVTSPPARWWTREPGDGK